MSSSITLRCFITVSVVIRPMAIWPQWSMSRPKRPLNFLSRKVLTHQIDTVGADRVVFGTGWSYDTVFDWPVSRVSSLESIIDEEKELILWKT